METERRTKGTMLWFAEAKGHGYILTEAEERLYVDRDGFVGGAAPVGRCAGQPVELTVRERDGIRIAVDVTPLIAEVHGRARRRSRG
jgi:cold shock CspA family protein